MEERSLVDGHHFGVFFAFLRTWNQLCLLKCCMFLCHQNIFSNTAVCAFSETDRNHKSSVVSQQALGDKKRSKFLNMDEIFVVISAKTG